MTTTKPLLVASKEPPVVSKPPTDKSYYKDSKLNNLKNANSKDEYLSVTARSKMLPKSSQLIIHHHEVSANTD